MSLMQAADLPTCYFRLMEEKRALADRVAELEARLAQRTQRPAGPKLVPHRRLPMQINPHTSLQLPAHFVDGGIRVLEVLLVRTDRLLGLVYRMADNGLWGGARFCPDSTFALLPGPKSQRRDVAVAQVVSAN